MFYIRAGKHHHPEAAHLVGSHHMQAHKLGEAATWFSRAAMAGHAHAQRE